MYIYILRSNNSDFIFLIDSSTYMVQYGANNIRGGLL